jgi:hypothetical protein
MTLTWIGHGMDMGMKDSDVGKKLSSKANIMSDRSSVHLSSYVPYEKREISF